MKKRILFVNGHVNVGGVEKSLVDLLRHLDHSRYDVDLLLLEDRGDYMEDVPDQVHIVFKDLKNTHGALSNSLRRCLLERDWLCFRMRLIFLLVKLWGKKWLRWARYLLPVLPDKAVYDCAIGYRPGICSDLVAYTVKAKKKVTWWHHGELNANASALAAYAQDCTFFDKIVAVSDGCAKMLQQAIPSITEKLTVVPNMLDVLDVRFKGDHFNPYPKPSNLRFVTVGRLFPEKHVENAVYVAELLIKKGVTDFVWHIVGDGDGKEKIKKLIREKHLEHVFSLEGSQSNPYPFIKDVDLYVHTSYVESQGLTILEAMALGVPCIVTRSIGPEGFIRNGENGILVEPNVEALTAGILDLIQSPDRCAALKKNTHCPNRFLPENIVREFEAVIS